MTRYIKLYFTCIKRSIITRLEYKRDTIISIFNFIFSNAVSISSIWMIMQSIPSLQGWSMAQLGFLYGFSMMPMALDHIFTDQLWTVAYFQVRNGDLDRMFIRPVPVLFQVIAETFQLEGFGELIVGIVMLAVCGTMIEVQWTFAVVLMLIVATVFGAVIITSVKIIFASFAFKLKSSGKILQVAYNFINFTRYPMKIYPTLVRGLLTFLLPFALIISYPVETLLFQTYSPYALCGLIVAVSAVFLTISIAVWSVLAKRYQSTGS